MYNQGRNLPNGRNAAVGQEIEWKFAADDALLRAVRAAYPGAYRTITMETTYFDTWDGKLTGRRVTLRRRLENGESVCTVKTGATGRCRGEWECRADSIEEGLLELCKLSGLPELAHVTPGALVPLCGARFTRQALLLPLEDGDVELALDAGQLLGGGSALPFWEIEVEGKRGDFASWERFADCLAARFSLKAQPLSKFRRALALAKGENHG